MSKRIKELLGSDPDGSLVKAEGWVKTRRDGKNVTFLEISDEKRQMIKSWRE